MVEPTLLLKLYDSNDNERFFIFPVKGEKDGQNRSNLQNKRAKGAQRAIQNQRQRSSYLRRLHQALRAWISAS